jgi:hypothetical protein
MPTMAFNDLFIHPREHDLVLGTHSRGVWIVDNVRALRELTPAGGVECAACVQHASGGADPLSQRDRARGRHVLVAADVRRAWTETMRSLATLRDQTRALNQRAQRELQALPANAPRARRAAAEELVRESTELASRAARLYGDASREVSPLTGIQREQEVYYRRMLAELDGGR